MSVGSICSRIVHVADPGERVIEVALRMRAANVGTVVVLDAARRPVGMLTDRDLVVRVIAEGREPEATTIESVMTREPAVAGVDLPVEQALLRMRQRGVRRLPVVDARGELIGIVSVDDVVELLAGEIGNVGRILAQSAASMTSPPPAKSGSARAVAAIERSQGEAEC